MISIHAVPPYQRLGQGGENVMPCRVGHGEPCHDAPFPRLTAEIGHFHPYDKADAAFRDFKGPARDEQATARNRLRQRRLVRPVNHEVIQ